MAHVKTNGSSTANATGNPDARALPPGPRSTTAAGTTASAVSHKPATTINPTDRAAPPIPPTAIPFDQGLSSMKFHKE